MRLASACALSKPVARVITIRDLLQRTASGEQSGAADADDCLRAKEIGRSASSRSAGRIFVASVSSSGVVGDVRFVRDVVGCETMSESA
jgi:hypothetical protein